MHRRAPSRCESMAVEKDPCRHPSIQSMPVAALSSTTKSTKNTKTSFLDRINKIDRMLYRAQSCESCNPVQNTSCTALRSLRLKTNTSAALFLTAEIAENAEKKALFVFFVAKTMAPRFAWAGGAAASRPCVDGEAAVPPPVSSPFLPRKTQKTTKSGDAGTILSPVCGQEPARKKRVKAP